MIFSIPKKAKNAVSGSSAPSLLEDSSTKAAKLLGISRTTLWRKIKELDALSPESSQKL